MAQMPPSQLIHSNSPLHARAQDKLVYAPHVYGPSVYEQSYFRSPFFPQNMPSIWARDFAFARGATGQPVVLGEMGGSYVGADKTWQDWALPYMVGNGYSVFYFALNPASDTGGLLANDWSEPVAGSAEAAKLAALEQLPSTDVFDICSACSVVSTAPSLPPPFIAPLEPQSSSVVPTSTAAMPPADLDLHPPPPPPPDLHPPSRPPAQ